MEKIVEELQDTPPEGTEIAVDGEQSVEDDKIAEVAPSGN